MRHQKIKTTPRVKNGSVHKKNNHNLTPNYWNTTQSNVIVDVEKPGKGYKHFLKKKDIIQFIEIIPNWAELSEGLDAIVLINGRWSADGYYSYSGVIEISAWEKEQDIFLNDKYYLDHQSIFDRLGVIATKKENGYFCEFNPEQIKAYQLLHILLHELGHHHDRMNTKSKRVCARGEDYAENYAFEYEKKMWMDYQNTFQVVF